MLPLKISELYDKCDEDDMSVTICAVAEEDGNLTLSLEIFAEPFNEKETQAQHWRITVHERRAAKILFDSTYSIKLTEDNPLLWEYLDFQCQLYFSGHTEYAELIYVQLLDVHENCFGNYIPFSSFINSNAPLPKVIQSGSGLIASGPEKLLSKYANVLNANNLKPSIIEKSKPVYWENGMYKPEPTDFSVLIIGDSYIIGRQFDFALVR